MFVNQSVVTPYGQGKIFQFSNDKISVIPTGWDLANGQKPTFYMNPKDVQPLYAVGETVMSHFGRGRIVEIRENDNIYVVNTTDWFLANGKAPTLYLNDSSIKKIHPSEFDVAFKKALLMKEQAKEFYVSKKFNDAKLKYAAAVDQIRGIRQDLSNEQRSQLFEMSVTCNSNLALCCFSLAEYSECILFGRNVITLLEALENSPADSLVIKSLSENGFTAEKLKDLKVKSLRVMGKAELKRNNFQEAKQVIDKAIGYSTNEKSTKELSDILIEATKRLQEEKKREKSIWQKAFKKGENSNTELYATVEIDKKDRESLIETKKNSMEKTSRKLPETEKKLSNDTVTKSISSYSWYNSLFNTFLLLGGIGAFGTFVWFWRKRKF